MVTVEWKLPAPARDVRRSERVREVALRFGLWAADGRVEPARHVELDLAPGALILITGASGAGKSTLLRAIRRELARRHVAARTLSEIPLPHRALVDCFGAEVDETLALLGRAGLAEAALWVRSPRRLSEGQRFRYRLARWMAAPPCVLLADEFAASLDRVTAQALAWRFQRFLRRPGGGGRAAVVATCHEDLAGDLRPSLHVRL